MIGYVLLISSVVIMASIVYMWMKTYIPKETVECEDSVSLILAESKCVDGNLSIRVKNNGLFNVDGFFIRASLKPDQEIATFNLASKEAGGFINLAGGLKPGKEEITPRIFSFNESACGVTTCATRSVCLGDVICDSLKGIECENTAYCIWNSDLEMCSAKEGVKKCQNITSFPECSSLSSLVNFVNPPCKGWISQARYYNLTSIEIVPIVFANADGKTRFTLCGNAKIQEDFKDCIIFKNLTAVQY
jgi:hypothetical protein